MGLIFLRNRVSGVAPAFDPASLFASGEEGVWYEPSTSTCFTDLGGFTFATYGQPVAHLIDKSQGATIEARRNLLKRTEEFDNAVWDVGGFTKTSYTETDPDGGNTALLITENDTSVSPYFRYNADVSDGTSQTFSVWIKATSEVSGVNLSTTGSASNSTITITTSWQRFDVTASTNHSTGPYIGGFLTITRGSGVGIYVWHPQLETGSSASAYQKITDGQTVSWLPGNHATQTSGDARPTLARVPEGGRRNLLEYTEEFDNAAWVADVLSVSPSATTDPNNGTNAFTLTPSGGSSPYNNRIYQLSTYGTATYTMSVWARSDVANAKMTLGLFNYGGQVFNLTSSWVRYSVTVTATGTSTVFNLYAGETNPLTGAIVSTNEIEVYGAQLELASSATAYQKVVVVDEYDITEAGVDSLDYLFDDQTDDVLPWTAPADTDYTISYVNTSGTVTTLTSQSLSGATDILLDPALVAYVAVDRALTAGETTDLETYLGALA